MCRTTPLSLTIFEAVSEQESRDKTAIVTGRWKTRGTRNRNANGPAGKQSQDQNLLLATLTILLSEVGSVDYVGSCAGTCRDVECSMTIQKRTSL
jgi:hypothetical protein